jgi:hypothetical protein
MREYFRLFWTTVSAGNGGMSVYYYVHGKYEQAIYCTLWAILTYLWREQ